MDEPKTLAEHLEKARAARDAEKLRESAANARAARKLKDCNCHQTPHTSKCVVYLREKQRIHRQKKETG
jgi:hypothetical protein